MRTRSWRLKRLRRYRPEIGLFLLGLVAMNLIFLARAFRGDSIDPTKAGQLGDFVGGYVGTLLALASILLFNVSLRLQRQATTRQHFESKYFQLLEMHRANVAEIQLGSETGRKVFVLLLRELRGIVKVIRHIPLPDEHKLGARDYMVLAFICLMYGTGPNSSRMLKAALSEIGQRLPAEVISAFEESLRDKNNKREYEEERAPGYQPFEGHLSRLGHYYRHLFQMVVYVDESSLPKRLKREFMKTIRAQLTVHEQALLLINWLSPLGHDWGGLITDYRLVRNVPQEFFHPKNEINVTAMFPKDYFEWQDRKRNLDPAGSDWSATVDS